MNRRNDVQSNVLHLQNEHTNNVEKCEKQLKKERQIIKLDIKIKDLPNTVLLGFIATWFLAASPIKRSVSVKAT
jgi:hypothetical protein